jgi:hypothetical protein
MFSATSASADLVLWQLVGDATLFKTLPKHRCFHTRPTAQAPSMPPANALDMRHQVMFDLIIIMHTDNMQHVKPSQNLFLYYY